MKRSKTVTLKIDPKTYRPNLRLTAQQYRRLDQVLSKERRTIRNHFKKDKWPLDYRIIQGNVLQDVFGEIEFYILAMLLKADVVWTIRKNKMGHEEPMLVADKRRKGGPIKRRKRVRK